MWHVQPLFGGQTSEILWLWRQFLEIMHVNVKWLSFIRLFPAQTRILQFHVTIKKWAHFKHLCRARTWQSWFYEKIGNPDFSTKPTNYYNLDVIISVGYRVKSHQGTKFHQWTMARLREYIVKGFTMNDELLKQAGGGNYFEELLFSGQLDYKPLKINYLNYQVFLFSDQSRQRVILRHG